MLQKMGPLQTSITEARSKAIARFATFEADVRAGELHKQGKRVRLQDQPFQVLRILVSHPGDLVTREEFRAQIWPEDTYVDFDNSLNSAVSKLREALGDSAENPRFVETLPRRGYRFIAPLTCEQKAGPRSLSVTWKITVPLTLAGVVTGAIAAGMLWCSC